MNRKSMSARETVESMIPTSQGCRTVWSPQEVKEAVDAYHSEVLREAADIILSAFNGYPALNYPPDFAKHLRDLADSPGNPLLYNCGHTEEQHQGPERLGESQCLVCTEDGERSWRHPYTPHDCVWVTALDGNNNRAKDSKGNTWEHCGICGVKKTNGYL